MLKNEFKLYSLDFESSVDPMSASVNEVKPSFKSI